MSRPYRILVRRVVEHDVAADDHSTMRLDLDSTAAGIDIDRVLSEALERNGWREVAPGIYERDRGDGETMRCDVAERTVTTRVQLEKTVSEEVQREVRGDTWNFREGREMTAGELEDVRRRASEQLANKLSAERKAAAEADLQREASSRLAAGEPDRRREVNKLVLEVTAEALKAKARELGTVDRLDEQWHGADYELTITVREG